MALVITSIEAKPDHKLRVTFRKYGPKLFDVRPYLTKGVFKELKDDRYFKKVRIINGGIEWPHEQDLSAETLFYRSLPIK